MTAFALCGAAMAAFAGSMHRHAPRILGAAPPGRRRRLRAAGWLLLGASAIVLLAGAPAWPVAIVGWIGWVAVTALGTTLVASVAPRLLLPAAALMLAGSLAGDLYAVGRPV